MDIILDQSSEDLLCCRVCLMTDCKLFNIHEYKLADTFSRISGTPIFKGRLPQYLCTYCHTLLLKCAKFRMTCLRTDQCLKKEVLKGQLNTDCIRRIESGTSRLFHLTLTEVEIADIPPSEKIIEPNVDIGLPKIERVYQAEPSTISIDDDTDDYETNSIDLEANMHTYNVKVVNVNHEASINTDEGEDIDEPNSVGIDEENTHTVNIDAPNIQEVGVVKRIIDEDMQETRFNTVNIAPVRMPELKMELEMLKGQLKIKVVENARNMNAITALKRTRPEMDEANKNESYKSIDTAYASLISDDDEDIGDSDIDDINEVNEYMYVVDVDSILKKSVKKCKRNIGITVKKNIEKSKDNSDNGWMERKVKYRNLEYYYLPEFDFAKFESDYSVKIVTLSKQEQLEEIAARKQSANYTTAQFPCEDCGKVFNMEPAYNNHRRRHSPSAGSHACEICHVRFKKAYLRRRHQDQHTLKFVCECGFVSRARCTAKMHHEMHNGRRFVCKHCGKEFSKWTSYLSHVRLSHAALNVACGACGETFVSEHGLKMHAAKMHVEFKCPTCSASFVSSDALKKHTDSGEHAGCPCEQCGESCASEEALQAHVGERHPSDSHRCEECRATFSSGAAFETHFRRKHLNERYKPTAAAAAADRAARRRRPGPRRAPPPPPPRGQFVCEQCGHIARGAALLRYHQNGHLAVKPFPCPECPKTFATNFLRNYHARTHKGERPFKCSECSLAFTQKANLKRHHNVVHLGGRASCHVCARVFTSKSSVRAHINSVHNGQPWPRRERRRKVAKD